MTQFLRTALVAKTASFPPGQQYVAGGDNPALDVFNMVQTFTSHVSIHDQDKRYTEFLKPDSNIRKAGGLESRSFVRPSGSRRRGVVGNIEV
jgi:hypothetical protein